MKCLFWRFRKIVLYRRYNKVKISLEYHWNKCIKL